MGKLRTISPDKATEADYEVIGRLEVTFSRGDGQRSDFLAIRTQHRN